MNKSLLVKGLRLLGFAAVFLLVLIAADFFLVDTDSVAALTIREMQQADDIQLAIVGSSVVRDHFNEDMITRETGLSSFSVTAPGAGFQTFAAITEELYKKNTPELLCLVLEPYNFNTAREDPEPSYKLMPWLTGLGTRVRYYAANAKIDGYWVDRALIFRDFPARSLSAFLKTVRMHIDPAGTFAEIQKGLEDVRYMGRGFLRHEKTSDLSDVIRQQMIAERDEGYDFPLLPESKEMLLAYRDSVEAHGTRFMVIISDNHTTHALAEPDYLRYMQHLMDFCRDNGIECYNLYFAKEEFLPNLDSFFYDLYHMTGEGADLETAAFCRLLNAVCTGEDVSGWFYEKTWQYRESITWITNAWVHPGEDGVFTVGCNTGSMVTPEYRFTRVAPDGTKTLLSDWSGEKTIRADLEEGENLLLEARLAEHPEQDPVFFRYPADYDYALEHADLY
ncbi:MAG: hypothetical protein IJ573_05680 [Clostridia bacterium]|nr:hypothetical protein [Clostridia bacterium]